ncbi:hypothetical protein GUJ93_ZPchr0010g10906 [Zizania palustris]|uniref:Uncharacterized protein n=1 Tax=Zizania palustris TaxID=103762 RepID=A0A8J5WG08_ZIZPA|nr:hypothetical protein GUJ93_ZPchr0010g10906 [Zizania palustris]
MGSNSSVVPDPVLGLHLPLRHPIGALSHCVAMARDAAVVPHPWLVDLVPLLVVLLIASRPTLPSCANCLLMEIILTFLLSPLHKKMVLLRHPEEKNRDSRSSLVWAAKRNQGSSHHFRARVVVSLSLDHQTP